MKKQNSNEQIKNLLKDLGCGNLHGEPVNVTGGLMHRMYKAVTDKAVFAVKELNPKVMQRPEALSRMINSEKAARALSRVVNAVAAKVHNGESVFERGGVYYMVYDWVDGRSLKASEITPMHCKKIGEALSLIHKENITVEGVKIREYTPICSDWGALIKNCGFIKDNGELSSKLQSFEQKANAAAQKLGDNMVISHGDLDPKNVLWRDDEPFIIDWEASEYINPLRELAGALVYWACDDNGQPSKEKARALFDAYKKNINISDVDWISAFERGYWDMLGWLQYNLLRATGEESSDEAEMALGKSEVETTVKQLIAYERNIKVFTEFL